MMYNDKNYVLVESKADVACDDCPLEDLCDRLADDFGIDYELCATEEDFGEFDNPVYEEKK